MLKHIKIASVITFLAAVLFNGHASIAKAENYGCLASNGVFTCSSAPDDYLCKDPSVQACNGSCYELPKCGVPIIAFINKTTLNMGDQLKITFDSGRELGDLGLTATLTVNEESTFPTTGDQISVVVNTANGFVVGGNNIAVAITNSKSDDIYFNASNLPPNITVNSTGSSSNTGTQTQTSSTPSGQTGNNTITGPTNPIQDTNLFDLFFRLLKILMGILGAIAVLMIIIGGFRMVIAQGNEEAYTKAKSTITWAIIGLVIALLSFSIVIIVQNILGANLPSVNTDSNGSVQVK